MELTIPQTLMQAVKHFSDPEAAWNFVKELRWPAGVTCPFCNHGETSFLSTRKSWKCKSCKKQFSVKTKSIFQGSPLPLETWLCAMWLITNAKNGISSYELASSLGVTQQTAWFMSHRIRKMMETGTFERLSGTVECDETWIGGRAKNMHNSRRKEMRAKGFPKVCVMGFKERGGRTFLKIVKNTKSETLHPTVKEVVAEGATLYTDAAKGYSGIGETFNHATVDHLAGQYVDGDITTNRIENVWSTLKRTYHGSHIHYSTHHTHRYLAETQFKVNNREQNAGGIFAIAVASVAGKRLTYKELVESGLSTMAP